MSIEKIDLFMPPISRYGVLNHFTKSLHDALMRQGVQCRLLVAERENPKPFLDSIFADPPDCTLSFNGLLPDPENGFFCDMIKIPHVACLVDSPYRFTQLKESPLSLITCPDQYACDFFEGMKFPRTFFLPHAADKELGASNKKKTEFDVIFLSSLIDYERIRNDWRRKYPLTLCQIMEDTAEVLLTQQSGTLVDALLQSIERHRLSPHRIDPKAIPYTEVMDEIETYVKGRDRVELIRGIRDVQINLFGANAEHATWKDYVGTQENVVIHAPVSYEKALELTAASKVALNSCAWIRYGGHERIFTAAASGTAVVTAENPYLTQFYKNDKHILYYRYGEWDKLNERVRDLVANDSAREEMAQEAKKITLEHHTWDQRAASLLKWLAPQVNSISPKAPRH